MSVGIHTDEGNAGFGHRHELAGGVALSFNFNLHGDAACAKPGRTRVKRDDISQVYGLLELNAIHSDCDPLVYTVSSSFNKARLVDIAQNHATEDGAVLVGVLGHGDNPQP